MVCPGVSDPAMNRLARCSSNCKRENNLRRNLQTMLVRTGRQLNVKMSWIACPVRVLRAGKVKKQIVDWPMILCSDWIKAALTHRPEILLGGNPATPTQSWQNLFGQFWKDYEKCDPTHPIYHEVDVGKRGLFLPLGHHGDEGRGRVRIPVLIENFCPVIGWKGLDFTSLSGTLVCTKFMFFILFSHTHKVTTNN